MYGETKSGPVVLDARPDADRSTQPGIAPTWVSEYTGIAVDDNGTSTAYPVLK